MAATPGTTNVTNTYIDPTTGESIEVEISLRDALLFDLLAKVARRLK